MQPNKKLPYWYHRDRTPTARYSRARAQMRKNKVKWGISKEEFIELAGKNCHYCECIIYTSGTGLDRINPDKHYTIENVVPSCSQCNLIRNRFFTVEEMKTIGKAIKKVKKRRKKAGGSEVILGTGSGFASKKMVWVFNNDEYKTR